MTNMLRAPRSRGGRLRAACQPFAPLLAAGTLALAGCGGSSHAAGTVATSPSAQTPVATGTAVTAATSHARGGKESAAAGGHKRVPYVVRTSSMEPTYRPEETVHYDPARTSPRVGEVVVFHLPVGYAAGSCGAVQVGAGPCPVPVPGLTKILAIKRVAGLPGDTIAIHAGRVIRNGKPEPELPTIACGKQEMVGCELPKAITVPAGHYFLMSTNLGLYKEDSRIFGPVPKEAIVGTVVGR